MTSKRFAMAVLSCAVCLAANQASAERLPADPLAYPSSGVQHPSTISIPKSAPPNGSLDYQRNIQKSFGNSNWGGGYRVYEHVRAPSPGFQSINFDYYARGRLFGKDVEGFRLHGATWNPRNDFRASKMEVLVLGSAIFNQTQENANQFGETSVAWNRTPFDRDLVGSSKTFTLGPVPVTVSGKIRARIGVNVAAEAYRTSATRSGVSLSGTASGRLYGRLSAGVGVWGASAGVAGSVTLAEVRAAKNVNVDRMTSTRVDYNNDFRVTINSLDGEIDLYAELFGARWDKTILDWDGVRLTFDIAEESGSINF